MSKGGQTGESTLSVYLARLRSRARLRTFLTVALLAGAALTATLLVAAASSGPVVNPRTAAAWWAMCLSAPIAVAGWYLLRERRGLTRDPARLLRRHAPNLARPVQSAVELSAEGNARGYSKALVDAHVDAVAERLHEVPPQVALPWSDLWRPSLGLALAVCLLGGLALQANPHLHGGLLALGRPAALAEDGVLTAPIASNVEARLVYPSYLRKPPQLLPDATDIEAPVGTTLELSFKPRLEVQESLLVLGDQRMRMNRVSGRLTGRVVVRDSGRLDVQVRSAGQWYRDTVERQVVARADDAPIVEIHAPLDGAWVDPESSTPVRFRAQDDEGLAELTLVVRPLGGAASRRALWSADTGAEAPQQLEDAVGLVPSALGVRPGDRFEVWLEARDGDAVSGPNQGESQHITLEALSDAQHLSQHLPNLKRVLDLSVVSLAERLERPMPKDGTAARARHRALAASEDAWLVALDGLVDAIEAEGGASLGMDREQLSAVTRRFRRLRSRERQLHRGTVSSKAARGRANDALVQEGEKDVLLLADLLSQAHLDEAGALSEELRELKLRIQALLRELSESDDEEAKRALLAEIARAERRLEELMRSMANLASHVPSEFVNQDALEQQSASAKMNDLRQAVQQGDLDAAAQHLEALERKLEALSSSLETGGLQFRQSRFGKRDEAMMRARERLDMLSAEQETLAQQSAERARQIMERGGQGKTAPTGDLQQMADSLSEQLGELGGRPMSLSEQRSQAQAKARLEDTRAALETGDLGEAGRMGAAGERAMERLARTLEDDARMFEGHDGLAGERAQAARRMSDRMGKLREAIDQRTPRLDDRLTEADSADLDLLKGRQRRTRQAAKALQESLEGGPDGVPLSPEGAESVRSAEQAMREAEQRLDNADLQDASAAQQEAAEQLKQLSEQLAQKQSGRRQGKGRRPGGDGRHDPGGRVDIPDAEDFDAPVARRRRILDAMREGRPPGFGGAVDAYYRELLR